MGRRARDELLAGEVAVVPTAVPPHRRSEIHNTMLFVSDDLREAALAVGGIESFLIAAQRLLREGEVTPQRLLELVDEDDLDTRLAALDDTIAALRRSLAALADKL